MKKLAILSLLALATGAFASSSDTQTVNCSLLVQPFVTLVAPSSLQIVTTAGRGDFESVDTNNLSIGSNADFVITLDTTNLHQQGDLVTSGNEVGVEAFITPWAPGTTYMHHGVETGRLYIKATNVNEGNAVASSTPYSLGSFTITVSQV